MTDKIKGVNSLEDLERLEVGNFIKIKNYAENGGLIFEGKIQEKYCFMQINHPVIWSERINKENIRFEDGMIVADSLRNIKTEMYNKEYSCYQEKLNIFKRAGVIQNDR